MIYVIALICPIMVFLAYREGIKTGLSINQGKVPPITPKAIKEEKQVIKEEQEKQKEATIQRMQMAIDVEEALNFANLYKKEGEE